VSELILRRFAGFTPYNARDRIGDHKRWAAPIVERQWRPRGDRGRFDYFLPMYALFLAIRSTEHFQYPRRRRSPGSRA